MDGPAAKRSPTSFCTIATHATTLSSSIVRMITVAATPYGRLATTLVGAGSSASRSSLTASAKCSVVFSNGSERLPERQLQPAVELDHVHVRHALGQVLGQHAEPAADLQHHVLGRQVGEPADDLEDVRVDEEVLAQVAVRPDAELAHAADRWLRWLTHQPKSFAAFASTARSSSS